MVSRVCAKVGATRAPTNATARRLEREIVILILECSWEVFEIFAAFRASRRTLRPLGLPAAAPSESPAFFIPPAPPTSAATSATPAEHDQLAHVDLGAVAGLAAVVLPLPVLDAAFDEQLVAL